MTKKELVKLLNDKFDDDEVVKVRSWDDGIECVDDIVGVEEVTQHFCDYKYEVLDANGEWTPYKDGRDHPARNGYKDGEYRMVDYRKWEVTSKCVCI